MKKNVVTKLKKVEGQIRGINRMIESGKCCEQVLVQFQAVIGALAKARIDITRCYLEEGLLSEKHLATKGLSRKALINELVLLIKRCSK